MTYDLQIMNSLTTFIDYARIDYCDICKSWGHQVVEVDGTHICRDCFCELVEQDKLKACYHCGDIHFAKYFVKIESEDRNKYFCPSCYNSHCVTCSVCGEVYLSEEMEYDIDGYPICPSCISSVPRCEICGRIMYVGFEDRFCDKCKSKIDYVGESYKFSYHDWDNEFIFHDTHGKSLKPDKGTRYMGFELEVEPVDDDDYRDEIDELDEGLIVSLHSVLSGYAHYESDGSLNYGGTEIISMPMTLDKHISLKETYQRMMKSIEDFRYGSSDNTGFHVHVSTTDLTDKTMLKILYLLDKYRIYIIKLSGRTSHYAKYYSMCNSLNILPDQRCDYDILDRWLDFIRDNAGHGIFLNLQKYPDSMEFRMFGSTTNPDYMLGYLQFVNRIIEVANENDLESLRTKKFREMFTGVYKELDTLIFGRKVLLTRE